MLLLVVGWVAIGAAVALAIGRAAKMGAEADRRKPAGGCVP